MKRVLQVISTLEQGGTESVVLNYMAHMDEKQVVFDFLVVWGNKKGFYEDYLESRGSRIFRLKNAPNKFFRHRKELKRFFTENKYEIVHIHAMSSLRGIIAKTAKKSGVQMVIYHSHTSSNDKHLLLQKLLKRGLNRWCDVKFACSDIAGKYMYRGDYTVLSNAIDTEHFAFNEKSRNEIRDKFKITDKLVIGNIGRLSDGKNQQYILKIAEFMPSESDFVILLVGDGNKKEDLIKFAKGNELLDKVIFAGNVGTEVYKYYSAFDVLAFPSLFEGLSMVLMEAQANGLPIVASDTITRENRVSDNFAFLPITETNECYEKWAKTIIDLDSHRASGKAVAENGYEISDVAKKLQGLYLDGIYK